MSGPFHSRPRRQGMRDLTAAYGDHPCITCRDLSGDGGQAASSVYSERLFEISSKELIAAGQAEGIGNLRSKNSLSGVSFVSASSRSPPWSDPYRSTHTSGFDERARRNGLPPGGGQLWKMAPRTVGATTRR